MIAIPSLSWHDFGPAHLVLNSSYERRSAYPALSVQAEREASILAVLLARSSGAWCKHLLWLLAAAQHLAAPLIPASCLVPGQPPRFLQRPGCWRLPWLLKAAPPTFFCSHLERLRLGVSLITACSAVSARARCRRLLLAPRPGACSARFLSAGSMQQPQGHSPPPAARTPRALAARRLHLGPRPGLLLWLLRMQPATSTAALQRRRGVDALQGSYLFSGQGR
jgi:hypothetical protein